MPPRKSGYQGRHNRDDDSPGAYVPKVKANAPGKAGTKGPTATRRRGAQHDSGETAKRKPTGAAAASQKARRHADMLDAARDYAQREAIRRTEGPPSIVGRAAGGAAAGAAAGGAVGGPVGAAAGAVVGGTGGALAGAKAKRLYKKAMKSNLGARRIIVAEFLVCMVVLALSPLTDKNKDEGPTAFMRRATAVMALFLILGLVSAAGRGASKLAAGFGGLVTVTLLVSERSLFMKIADLFTEDGKGTGRAKKPPPDDDVDDVVDPDPAETGAP